MSGLTVSHDCLILDADCIINLASSGQIIGILSAVPCPCFVARYVNEMEVLRDNLQACISARLLVIASPEGDEYESVLRIVYETGLGNGEAETGAIAANRNWAIAIDDRKARNYFGRTFPGVQLLSTPELMKHWVETAQPSREDIKIALERVLVDGRYRIGVSHELYGWWQAQLI